MGSGGTKIGMWASAACAVHCAATGILVAAAPLLVPDWMHDFRVEVVLLSVTVLFGGYSAITGWRRHRSLLPGLLLVCGLAAVLASSILVHMHSGHHRVTASEAAISVLGGSMLVAFFVLNGRLAARCSCPACAPEGVNRTGKSRVRPL